MNYSLKTIKECYNVSSYEVCISCSFFKMKSAYRKSAKYLEYFNKWFHVIPKSAYVRMYVDESILEDKDFIKLLNKNYKKLEVIFFEFADFKDGVYHDGTFGSIIRFLPLFNKPSLPKNIKYIWITDMDMPSYIFTYDNIKDMKNNNVNVSFYSKACNNREWFPKDVRYPISAGRIISDRKIKYEWKTFETFLYDLIDNKYQDLKEKILNNRRVSNSHYVEAKYFTYGFDELYVNLYLNPLYENYKYMVYYEIDLDFYKEISSKSEYKSIVTNIWKNKENTLESRYKLREFNDEIYDIVKDLEFKDERLKICINDYNLYRDKIDTNIKNNWGLFTRIIA